MKNEHIISLIEENSIGSLNETDLHVIQVHIRGCDDCLRAFQAARVSQSLLKERVAAEFEPTPFFHTRVLATLRERQAVNESWSFVRLWKATGALASTMIATCATLAVLTFALPEAQPVSSLANPYSAEEVILNQTAQAEEDSDVQLLTTIYGGEEEPSR